MYTHASLPADTPSASTLPPLFSGRESGWRWRVSHEFKNHGDASIESYRKLSDLRRSRFIDDDPYGFPRTDDPSSTVSLSHSFPHLRRLVISLRDYTAENGDAQPPPWTRTVAVLRSLPRLAELRIEGRNDYGPSASFGELVSHGLELACGEVRRLELQGRFPAWDRAAIDQNIPQMACAHRLESLTLCGTNVAGVFEKLLAQCPCLREIDYNDEVLTLFEVDENGARFASSLAEYSRRLGSANGIRRLKLRQTVLGVYIANRVGHSVNFLNRRAMIELGMEGWPKLRELDVRIENDSELGEPRSDDGRAIKTFFSRMPQLRILKLELDVAGGGEKSAADSLHASGGGTLRKILEHLPLLEEITMNESKIRMNIDDWTALCIHQNLRRFTCHLTPDSPQHLDQGLREGMIARRRVIEKEGYRLPLLRAMIYDCPRLARTQPLVCNGDALISFDLRLRVIIPNSTSGSRR